ncbi:hypothetical protein Tco_0678094 [Tanacetum coccineum]|uniref:Uncharacterized protein n=1 Tax=Tanacetum coccineum TaxID=301880 RepID=A0ABQ4XEQ6_9ASTR
MQSSKNNTKGSYELLKISLDKISENFNVRDFIMELNVHVVTWNHLYNGIPLRLLKNLYVPFGIPFDPKRYYKDGAHTNIAVAKTVYSGVGSNTGEVRWAQSWVSELISLGDERICPDKGGLEEILIEIFHLIEIIKASPHLCSYQRPCEPSAAADAPKDAKDAPAEEADPEPT